MIRYLSIRNLAVIESVKVDFEQSFNVLTGETGAGKSILVEAVGLLLGGRATTDLIRTGEDIAAVEAIFESADGEELVVRREITAQGRSRAFINGALATAGALKDLSQKLVELHGQHEHQQLLDPAQHLRLLDHWAGLDAAREQVAIDYTRVHALRDQIDRLRMDDRERAARLDLVEFQLGELNRAAVQTDEDEALAAERQVLRSADLIRRLCAESYSSLYEAEGSALATLGQLWKKVGELAAIDSRFAAYLSGRDAIKAQLEDLAFELRDYGARIDTSPSRLQDVEDRLALLERLKRKFGPTLGDVLARQRALSVEHAGLVGGTSTLDELTVDLTEASRRYLEGASSLSQRRHTAAKKFDRALEGELGSLAMAQTRFETRLVRHEAQERWTGDGIDGGEFFLSPNPGEDLRPLAQIVSGGELSRVMLALKTLSVRGSGQAGKTLIFDEVDAGIGGRVASVVGEKLAALGSQFQVLCITHLPQIAACGQTHFHIDKRVEGRRTTTHVTSLNGEARVAEIARMMGGAAAGAQAAAGARELLDSARARRGAKAKGESRAGAKAKP